VEDVVGLPCLGPATQNLGPAWSDYDQRSIARSNGAIECLGEIFARPNVFDIHKQAFTAYDRRKVIGQTSGIRCGVLTPVADEDVVRV
jgi:hypothetical protein